ncbi:hypothetical protein AMTRI_Chr04g180610 [Amborella trichopoda]
MEEILPFSKPSRAENADEIELVDVKKNQMMAGKTEYPLLEILSRLPLKSVLKFRCVNKRWYRLLCDPFFIQAYCLRSAVCSGFIIESSFFNCIR